MNPDSIIVTRPNKVILPTTDMHPSHRAQWESIWPHRSNSFSQPIQLIALTSL